MKLQFAAILILGLALKIQAQTIVTNFQENQTIYWCSVSVDGPCPGFFGQEFSFEKSIQLKSISVFIVDHSKHDETNASVNFSVWNFDDKPTTEIFRSEAISIAKEEVNGWKTFVFKDSININAGRYLIGIGQSQIQGFVAFGSGFAKQDYKSKNWGMMPIEGFTDGTEWFDLIEISKKMGVSEEDIKKAESGVLMMKLEYN